MTDIGEAVAVSVPAPDDCPFCNSEEDDPQYKELTFENDSAILARNCGGMPSKTLPNPEAEKTYEIYERYWVDEDKSKICFNAHHVIPGNAAFAKAYDLRKWLSGKNVVKKIFYDKAINEEVRKHPVARREAKRRKLVEEKYPAKVIVGPPDAVVTYRTVAKRKAIHRENTIDEKHVTGAVDFDINSQKNGIWLPSNNAIADWEKIKNVLAEDMDGEENTFALCYAYNAMKSTGVQFHDSHEAYSEAVLEELKKLAVEVRKLALYCHEHEGSQANENQGKPYPAPKTLPSAIYRLGRSVARRLDVKSVTPAKPWVTSELALQWE